MDVNLQDQILTSIAKKMQQELDNELMMTMFNWKPFTLSKGTVYGTEYSTVHPNNGAAWNEMMQWMIDTFGPSAEDGVWTPDMRWYANNAKFWFREEKDLLIFLLKWS